MLQFVNEYITSKALAWSQTTLRSEAARLRAVAAVLAAHPGDPAALWMHLEANQAPYSRVTTWTRVTDFYDWLQETGKVSGEITGGNPYRTFRKRNARLFKYTYTPRLPEISFEEAVQRIETIEKDGCRELAKQIIGSGQRWAEAIQYKDTVIGKGAKPRNVFRPNRGGTTPSKVDYSTFRRSLRAVGLKPHTLRKLCATRLVDLGLKEADLMKVMGWSNINTAKAYLQPKQDKELARIFEQIHKEL